MIWHVATRSESRPTRRRFRLWTSRRPLGERGESPLGTQSPSIASSHPDRGSRGWSTSLILRANDSVDTVTSRFWGAGLRAAQDGANLPGPRIAQDGDRPVGVLIQRDRATGSGQGDAGQLKGRFRLHGQDEGEGGSRRLRRPTPASRTLRENNSSPPAVPSDDPVPARGVAAERPGPSRRTPAPGTESRRRPRHPTAGGISPERRPGRTLHPWRPCAGENGACS